MFWRVVLAIYQFSLGNRTPWLLNIHGYLLILFFTHLVSTFPFYTPIDYGSVTFMKFGSSCWSFFCLPYCVGTLVSSVASWENRTHNSAYDLTRKKIVDRFIFIFDTERVVSFIGPLEEFHWSNLALEIWLNTFQLAGSTYRKSEYEQQNDFHATKKELLAMSSECNDRQSFLLGNCFTYWLSLSLFFHFASFLYSDFHFLFCVPFLATWFGYDDGPLVTQNCSLSLTSLNLRHCSIV